MAAAIIALLEPAAAQVITSIIAYKQSQKNAAGATGPTVAQLVAAAEAQVVDTDNAIIQTADAQLGVTG